MSEEKRKVLEMLEQGKINVEEAHKLLEALGESGAPQEGPAPAKEEEAVPAAALDEAAGKAGAAPLCGWPLQAASAAHTARQSRVQRAFFMVFPPWPGPCLPHTGCGWGRPG